jgi:hypothetical protein
VVAGTPVLVIWCMTEQQFQLWVKGGVYRYSGALPINLEGIRFFLPFPSLILDLLRNTPTRIIHSTFPYHTLNSAELQMIIPQSTGYQHNFIIKTIFSVAKLIRNYPESLNSSDSVLHKDSETTNNPVPSLRIIG